MPIAMRWFDRTHPLGMLCILSVRHSERKTSSDTRSTPMLLSAQNMCRSSSSRTNCRSRYGTLLPSMLRSGSPLGSPSKAPLKTSGAHTIRHSVCGCVWFHHFQQSLRCGALAAQFTAVLGYSRTRVDNTTEKNGRWCSCLGCISTLMQQTTACALLACALVFSALLRCTT